MSKTATYFKSVTPSDTATFDVCDALYIGVAGNIVIDNKNGTAVTFAVQDGQILPIKVDNVQSTLTTATGIIALYD